MDYDDQGSEPPPYQHELSQQVGKKEERKLRARQQDRSIWFGLGMFGLVGWSIAIPTLIGIAIGIWIDRNWQHGFSCTLICMFVGIAIGCSTAWYWIKREVLDFTDSDSGESSIDAGSEGRQRQES
jgi:ATP synthase protein I